MKKLHAQMGSPGKDADVARQKLIELLAEHGLSWNDLTRILAAIEPDNAANHDANPGGLATPRASSEPNLFPLLMRLIEEHVAATPDEHLAIALWILHTWIFDRFSVTPRLALLSPVRGCGKTTLLSLIELLVSEGARTDHTTAAAIYYQLERRPRTVLLVDEADGLNLLRNHTLRTIFNSGHRRGGAICRFVGGWPQRYPTFAPLAIAAIGILPLPLMHRSVVVNLQRSSTQLRRLDEADPAFNWARQAIRDWAAKVQITSDPEMPSALSNRTADNWRSLLAIADAFGRGEEARAAAVALSADRPDEDPGVVLLTDIRNVFQARGADRITSSALIEALLGLEDNFWSEWRGLHDDRLPRKLNEGELGRLLRPFGIRTKTIWRAQRRPGDKSSRGYLRSQFEAAWARYCPSTNTPTQSNKIIWLPQS